MVASVLNTKRAIQVGAFVVRAFVKLREMLATHKELAHKLAELERELQNHVESIRSLVVGIR
jgi:phage regulator Rha-like protein